MKTRQFIKSFIALVLCLTVGCSTAITVFAGSTGGGSGGGTGGGFYSGGWGMDAYGDLIRITASRIDNTSKIDDMANLDMRYGNMYAYPLYMTTRSGNTNTEHNISFDFSNLANNVSKLASEASKSFIIHSDAKEFDMTASNDKSDLFDTTVNAYLERCAYNISHGTYSDFDKICFWYFYTRMAIGANTDNLCSLGGVYSSKLGDTLNKSITQRIDGFSNQTLHERMLKRGYIVALYSAYGATALCKLADDTNYTFESINISLGNLDTINDKLSNFIGAFKHNSFVVDRMMVLYLNGEHILCTVAEYLKLAIRYDANIKARVSGSANVLKEGQFIENYYDTYTDYQIGGYMGVTEYGQGYSYGAWESLAGFAKYTQIIRPTNPGLADNNRGAEIPILDVNNKTIRSNLHDNIVFYFGGWGYYPFESTDTNEPPYPSPTEALYAEPEKNINMQVTYNAFLGGLHETNDYGTNGHVMTDTVLITKPFNWDDFKQLDSDKTFSVQLDKDLKLDTPFKGTTYSYTGSYYKITDAFGANTYVVKNGDKYERATNTTASINIEPKYYGNYMFFGIDAAAIDTAFLKSNDVNLVTVEQLVDSAALDATSTWLSKSNEYGWYRVNKPDGSGAFKDGKNITYDVYLLELFEDEACTKPVSKKFETNFETNVVTQKDKNGKLVTIKAYNGTQVYKWFNYYIGQARTYNNGSGNEDSKYAYLRFYSDDGLGTYKVTITNGRVAFIKKLQDQNLSIQLRVNYVANTNEAYDNKFKAVNMKSYMLSQNNIVNDFIKDNEKAYTMIDNYATDLWGNLNGRDRVLKTNAQSYGDGATVDTVGTTNSGTYTAIVNANEALSFGNGLLNMLSNNRAKNGNTFNSVFSTISTSDKIGSNEVRRVYYTTRINKTVPIFATGGTGDTWVGRTLANTATNFWLDANDTNRKANISKPLLEQTNGKEITSWNSSTKTNGIYAENDIVYSSVSPNSTIQVSYSQSNFNKILATYSSAVYVRRSNFAAVVQPVLANWVSANSSNTEYSRQSQGREIEGLNTTNKVDYKTMFVRFGMVRKTDNATDSYYNFKCIEGTPTTADNDKGINSVATSLSSVRFTKNSASTVTQGTVKVANAFTQSSYDVKLDYDIKGLKVGETDVNNRKPVIQGWNKPDANTIGYKQQYTVDNNPDKTGYIDSNNKVFLQVVPEVDMFGENQWTDSQRKLVANGDLPTGQDRPQNTSYYKVTTAGQQFRYVPAVTYSSITFGNSGNVSSQVTGTAVAFDTRAKNLATRLGGDSTIPVLYSGSGLNIAYNSDATATVKAYAIDINGARATDVNGSSKAVKSEWGNGNYSAKTAATQSITNMLNHFDATTSNKMVIYDDTTGVIKDYDLTNPTTSKLQAGTLAAGLVYQLTVKGGHITTVVVKSDNVNVSKYTVSEISTGVEVTKINTFANATEGTANVVTPPAAVQIKSMLENMNLVGTNNILAKVFESGSTSYTVEGDCGIAEQGLLAYLHNQTIYNVNGSNRYVSEASSEYESTGKWYFEDTSVLVVREYTANLTASAKETATEQIPINMGPATSKNKNNYFSEGYKGFIVSSVEIKTERYVGTGSISSDLSNKVMYTKTSTHDKVDGSGKVSVWVDGNINASKANAAIAKPDFIISDVTINEATGF